MEPFKNIFSTKSVTQLGELIAEKNKKFDLPLFKKKILRKLDALEMKDRVRLVAESIEHCLPGTYPQQVKTLLKILSDESLHVDQEWQGEDLRNAGARGFMVWPLTQFVETYGLEHFDCSMIALHALTKRFTSEFAIRPFIELNPKGVQKYLQEWVVDPNPHVRRLVSEGTRPNLPWGKKVPWIKENLKTNIHWLEMLKTDDSEYVRRSVANHMNDISRLNEKLMLSTIKKWKKLNDPKIDAIAKHALRTLLKQGNREALKLLGYGRADQVKVESFKIDKKQIKDGQFLTAQLSIKNTGKKELPLMIDYQVSYCKKNGDLSDKVFKWKTLKLKAGEKAAFDKKIDFKKVTTRRHYPGRHFIQLQVNGQKLNRLSFELKK